jgi:hypothetical protein
LKFISDTKWLSLITETYLKGLDAHTDKFTKLECLLDKNESNDVF